jgi:hypothetical protein
MNNLILLSGTPTKDYDVFSEILQLMGFKLPSNLSTKYKSYVTTIKDIEDDDMNQINEFLKDFDINSLDFFDFIK